MGNDYTRISDLRTSRVQRCKFVVISSETCTEVIVSQAFAVVRFLFHYAIPVSVFIYCYGRIFHTIRRQSKVVGSHHAARTQNITVATTSRDQNTEQIQEQAAGATTGAKLSRTEMNVLQTMIVVIVCFLIFWCVPVFANLLLLLGVSMPAHAA